MLTMTSGLGVGLALMGFLPNVYLASVLLALLGMGSGFLSVVMISWLQRQTEVSMLGRVMSVAMFASIGMAPFSYLLAGLLADLNPSILFASAGGIVLLAAAVSLMNPAVRRLE